MGYSREKGRSAKGVNQTMLKNGATNALANLDVVSPLDIKK